jgi:hypothetical protein
MISARLATGLHPIAAVLLALVGAPAAIPFVLLHGGGNGLLTIARGTLPLALFGSAGHGLRTGILAAPARILQGGAPLLFGLVLDRAGPYWALLLSGSITAASPRAFRSTGARSRPAAPKRRRSIQGEIPGMDPRSHPSKSTIDRSDRLQPLTFNDERSGNACRWERAKTGRQ